MTDLEKTKILLKTRKFPYTREGIEALWMRLKKRGNMPEALEYVSAVLSDFGETEIPKPKYTHIWEGEAPPKKATKKVAKKRTRGPNKKK